MNVDVVQHVVNCSKDPCWDLAASSCNGCCLTAFNGFIKKKKILRNGIFIYCYFVFEMATTWGAAGSAPKVPFKASGNPKCPKVRTPGLDCKTPTIIYENLIHVVCREGLGLGKILKSHLSLTQSW